jgi:hypothetical protein
MKRFLVLAALAFCLAVGCLGHMGEFRYVNATCYSPIPLKTIKVYVDKNFGPADKVAIDDALNQWNYALNGHIKLEVVTYEFDMDVPSLQKCMVVGSNCWMIMKVDSNNSMVAELDKTKKGKSYTLAWANEIGGNRMYLIRDRLTNEMVTGVTLHEMGHLLGSEHDDAYLMQPMYHWEKTRCVDYEALRKVAKYQHIPFECTSYCVYGNAGDHENSK